MFYDNSMLESLRDIRLFVAVYEERSFTAAATRENATQSGVSQHIRKIENRFGVKLFGRGSGAVIPTPAGDSYYRHCIDVLRSRELGVAALVVSETPGSTVALEDTIATVARFAGGVRMISLPRLVPDAFEHPAFAQLTDLLMALGNKD